MLQKAIHIRLNGGDGYVVLPLHTDGRYKIRSHPGRVDSSLHLLTAADLRTNWNDWLFDLACSENILSRDELDQKFPGIEIDLEPD